MTLYFTISRLLSAQNAGPNCALLLLYGVKGRILALLLRRKRISERPYSPTWRRSVSRLRGSLKPAVKRKELLPPLGLAGSDVAGGAEALGEDGPPPRERSNC